MRPQPFIAALLALSLAGCVLRMPGPAAIPVPPPPIDTAEMRLVEAAERAERALSSLSRVLPPPDPAAGMPPLDAVPEALRRRVTIDWSGPLETLAAGLARRAGYRFLVAGPPPARPLIVSVTAENRPLIAVLRDAGLRAGGAATLGVDAAREAVVLDWAPPSRSEGEDG